MEKAVFIAVIFFMFPLFKSIFRKPDVRIKAESLQMGLDDVHHGYW